ncbi:PREDICTED: putative disease resistance protein RGA3 isoform X1 [Prunus mume]|uniref:Disease resistance protein RGA3 isoform X1 n=2 Tax=Prunus mume TaxID=102107 RepID=A0ABM0NRF9_PRUMU|nr:PREDICTED: putative disease resistance protein RGA3 isoform X1 [Prunus mume]
MAEALISVLLQQLASIIKKQVKQEVRLVVDVKKEVAKLTRNFKAIQVVLENAEERQMKEVDVRYWLDSLKDVSYEMDDVLDEWSTEILKLHIQKQGNAKKVCFYIPAAWFCFGHQVVLRLDIARKIKELDERLAQIASERQNYNFQPPKRGIEQIEQRKSSSFVDQTFGREVEKDILVKKLLSESGQARPNFLVIPIVGMGGIGKTTLAQLAYNDERVHAHFDNRIWVCVSDPFDEIKIAKAIIDVLKMGTSTPASNELQTLLEIVLECVKGKKFLLVLDDVWNDEDRKWEPLKLALQNGALGSRILVTTRKEDVAMMMGASVDTVNLKELSDENCWKLFCHVALGDREISEYRTFEVIGKEIVKKCKGLPLVAKTLGGLMRHKKTRKEWEDVLKSKTWELDVVEKQVFQPLLLSYYDLASTVKCCLLYCVIFPKGYLIEKDNLIELWMSQNYLNLIGNKEKEEVGEKYFNDLVMRSFFQEFEKDDLGNITRCKMHDVVHDFLQFLTKNECFVLEGKGGNKRIMEFNGENKARHLTLMFAPEGAFPSSLYSCKNLRTLATFDSNISTFGRELISQLKCLRTLNLSFNSIKEVPNEVGELAHLRYFDLSYNEDLMKLPDSVCNLMNLQTLRLIWCRKLERLPEGMGKLINLQHLYVMGCFRLKLPKAIARLTSLRTLDQVRILDVDNNKEALFELSDLRKFDQLRGSFRIEFLEDLKDARQAEKAHLVNKNCLVSLELRFFFGGTDEIPLVASQEETLNALQPPPNLESFSIYHYSGTTLRPHWMTSLNKLRILTLGYFEYVEFLPPLGRLESLEVLEIQDWPSLKKVGVEFLGIETQTSSSSSSSSPMILFPNLKKLVFEFLPMWEEWEGIPGWSEEEDSQKTITIMPCLSSLQIGYCGLLKTLPNFLRNTPLKELVIGFGCRILAQGCQKGRGGSEWRKISHIPNIKVWIGRSSEFVQKDGVWIGQQQTDDDETPSVASTSSSGVNLGDRASNLGHKSTLNSNVKMKTRTPLLNSSS